jgi:hypothetical protein
MTNKKPAMKSVTGKATGPHRNTAPFSVGDPVDGILVEKPTRGKQLRPW